MRNELPRGHHFILYSRNTCTSSMTRQKKMYEVLISNSIKVLAAPYRYKRLNMIRLFFLFAMIGAVLGFENVWLIQSRRGKVSINASNDGNNKNSNNNWGISSLLQEMNDMISSWDDVIDDFMFKRMGNGELFYGKRKYKPSNKTNMDGQYRGMGISDSTKIELARQRKEEMIERRRQQLTNRD